MEKCTDMVKGSCFKNIFFKYLPKNKIEEDIEFLKNIVFYKKYTNLKNSFQKVLSQNSKIHIDRNVCLTLKNFSKNCKNVQIFFQKTKNVNKVCANDKELKSFNCF